MRHWQIFLNSFRAVAFEISRNKLRSFLSLFGVTIGVFSIISVLALVSSLEHNIRSEMQSFGANTIYVDKWEYSATGPDFPYWKYARRPAPRHNEMPLLKQRTPSANYFAFKISTTAAVEHRAAVANRVRIYGISEAFNKIQPLDLLAGHYFTAADFESGSAMVVLGHDVAENLFGEAAAAINQTVVIKGKALRIAGVLKKQGRQLLGGWAFDESALLTYRFARTIMDESRADPLIMVQARPGVSNEELKGELKLALRAIHRLKPLQEDDFALNDINDFSTVLKSTFRSINLAGWAIGAMAFLVGIFGVANILFVSVRERTHQIGIKKALGATAGVILSEFLMESALLCLLGGIMGLLLVYLLTALVSAYLNFPVFVSLPVVATAFLLSLAAGLAAGFWPARQAAQMNPITAIRW